MSANAQGQSDKTLTRVSDIHHLESRVSPLDVLTFTSRKPELWKPPTANRQPLFAERRTMCVFLVRRIFLSFSAPLWILFRGALRRESNQSA
jgi:hypothetical protein